MKKLLLLAALLIFSCSKDDDKSNDSNSIEGRWNLVSMTDGGNPQEQSSCNLTSYMILGNGLGDYSRYDADGSNVPCTVTYTQAFSYSAVDNSSNTYYFTPANETNDEVNLMKVNGNSLIITYEGGDFVETITFIRD